MRWRYRAGPPLRMEKQKAGVAQEKPAEGQKPRQEAPQGAEVVQWRQQQAEQGNADAQVRLGFLYAEGQGVPQDYVLAAQWFRRAAEQGDAYAQFNRARRYAEGHGVSQNDAQAAEWYRPAAQQGYADSQYNLALLYADGQGVLQNYVQAYLWFNLAAVRMPPGTNHDIAVRGRDLVATRMTPTQLAEGQALARTWHPKTEMPPDIPAFQPLERALQP